MSRNTSSTMKAIAQLLELSPTIGSSGVSEDWTAQARCPEVDTDLFFPEKGGANRDAKRICNTCPVARSCLEWALDQGERFGVWGGLAEGERRILVRTGTRPAGAPTYLTRELAATYVGRGRGGLDEPVAS